MASGTLNNIYTARSGGVSAEVWFDLSALRGVVSDARTAQREAALAVIDRWIEEVTDWMKATAPWKNRTWQARLSLGVQEEIRGDLITLWITGGVFYMKYLEQYFAGRYRILVPAFSRWWPVLMQRLGAIEEG